MSPHTSQPPLGHKRGPQGQPAALRPRPWLTRHMADRHEALWLRLDALIQQVEAKARRRPRALVPADLRVLAEDMLFETARFGPLRPRRSLPMAADHVGPLAAQLLQAREALASFESRNTRWDLALGRLVWRVTGEKLAVRRIKPKPLTPAEIARAAQADAAHKAKMLDLREKLAIRIEQFKRR